eukprot:1137411-Pelagomonas_calceolata.AAC.4
MDQRLIHERRCHGLPQMRWQDAALVSDEVKSKARTMERKCQLRGKTGSKAMDTNRAIPGQKVPPWRPRCPIASFVMTGSSLSTTDYRFQEADKNGILGHQGAWQLALP